VILAARASRWQVWRTYGWLGVTHILAGWDHLLFVVALVLLVRRGWAVARAVTAFTVAHSLTLVGTTLGVVGLPQAPVEALIALSIVFLAAELLRAGDGGGAPSVTLRYPWAIAFAFGLVHGFGFAGALRKIGLPDGEVPAALLAFNLGVEAGQLAIVVTVLATLAALARIARPALAPAVRVAAYAIGVTASYWLIDRISA
jgi:hydrogenase/urease accessory protein HupE